MPVDAWSKTGGLKNEMIFLRDNDNDPYIHKKLFDPKTRA
jgi:hypothetical protein